MTFVIPLDVSYLLEAKYIGMISEASIFPSLSAKLTHEFGSPTRLLRRAEGLKMLLVSDQTFFQDTEGNVTELCTSAPTPDLFRSMSHISDSFSSDISLT